jgi:hypothetical protein
MNLNPSERDDSGTGRRDQETGTRTGPGVGATREVLPSPWLTAREAAARARVGVKTIYRAARARNGALQAAVVGGRRELRFLASWVDEWLIGSTTTNRRERAS